METSSKIIEMKRKRIPFIATSFRLFSCLNRFQENTVIYTKHEPKIKRHLKWNKYLRETFVIQNNM